MKFMRVTQLTPFFTLLFSSSLYAAAFQFYELGAPSNGTANVGQAALAYDASTAYYNPAGMSALNTTQLMLGTQMLLSYTNFSKNAATTIAGSNGGNAGALVPGASAFFVYSYSPKLKFGASLTSPFGGLLNYDTHWVGRYFVQQMQLYTVNFNPSLAWQANEWFAVGAGIAIEYANLYQTIALPVDPSFDGQMTLKVSNAAAGFNAGILITPTHGPKVGLAYRSQIVHHMSGNANFLNVSDQPSATSKLVMPANVILSLSQPLTDQITVLGELGWTNWSSMVNSLVYVHGYSLLTPQNWHDTYRIGLGAQYHTTPALLIQGGLSFDSSPTSATHRLPDLPMNRQIRVGLGLIYNLLEAVKLGLSYEYLNLGSARINNTTSNGVLNGSYSRNSVHAFQASLNIDC